MILDLRMLEENLCEVFQPFWSTLMEAKAFLGPLLWKQKT